MTQTDTAASEVIAVVILIAVFAVAVGIVGVVMLSNPPADAAPAMLASVTYDNSTDGDHHLVIRHEGGDPLRKGEFQIFVNGEDRTDEVSGEDGSRGWTVWENGQALTLAMGGDPEPRGVLITSAGTNGGGTRWVLHLVGEGGTGTVTPTTGPTPVPTPGGDTLLNTADGKPGTLLPGGYLEFRVTGAYSYVEIEGQRYDLSIGDRVKLVVGDDGNGHIDISDSRVTQFAYDDIALYINRQIVRRGLIDEIYVSGQQNLVSTLTLRVPPATAWTQFVVDGTTIIDYWADEHGLILYNLMPASNGVMNLDNPSPTGTVYFTGSISGYVLQDHT